MKQEKEKMLAKMAYMYYVEGRTQADIAKEFNLYRTTVSRMLTQARQEGIVQIEIKNFDSTLFELESYAKNKYGLTYLEVVPSADSDFEEEQNGDMFSVAAANVIRRVVQENQTIGVSWGATLAKAIGKLEKKQVQNVTFIPLAGGPSHINSQYHVNTLVYELSRKFQGKNVFINASVVQETAQLAEGIMLSKYFSQIRQAWDELDVAIVGIGGPLLSGASQWRDLLNTEDYAVLQENQAVGDCCCRFFDEHGHVIQSDLHRRTIAITLEQIKKVPVSLGIASGKEKAKAILALLRKKYINSLVTDQETLLQILKEDGDEV